MIPADAAGDPRLEKLTAFETRHTLFEATVDGWSMWRILRRVVHRALTAEDQPDAPSAGASLPDGKFGTLMRVIRALKRPAPADLVIISFTSALRDRVGDRYRDIYFDALLDTGLTACKIETRNSSGMNARSALAERPAQVDLDALFLLAKLRARLRPAPPAVRDFAATLSARLSDELGVTLSARWIERTIAVTREQARLYEKLLRRVKPRAVLVADTAEFAMLIAAPRAGVPLIEVQHGTFTAEHPDAIPALPALDQASLLLPDRYAAFGNYWKRELAGRAMPAEHIVPVGYAMADRMRALRAARTPDGTLRILLTSQGIATAEVASWLDTLATTAPAGLDWRLHVKLHPAYEPTAEAYAGLAKHKRIEIVPGDREPLTVDLLANADLHLSISSTSHFDAISIGVPTVILPLASHEIIRFIADDRAAFVAKDPADIWRIVRSVPEVPDEGHDFCAPGYVQNLRSLIDAL